MKTLKIVAIMVALEVFGSSGVAMPTFEEWTRTASLVDYDPQAGIIRSHATDNTLKVSIHAIQSETQLPWCTLLHGFPTSSLDWAVVAGRLQEKCHVLMFDFIGFGNSSKPTQYEYSSRERAQLAQALWSFLKIKSTHLVAHDFGDNVAVELLRLQKRGHFQTRITKAVFLNGGLYHEFHRPTLGQKILLHQFWGKIFANHILNRRIFAKQFASSFSKAHPVSENDIDQYWASIQQHDGTAVMPQTIHYITDRKQNQHLWEPIIEDANVPVLYLWGLDDPISGHHMLTEIENRNLNGSAQFVKLQAVGHYPQHEVPDEVAKHIMTFIGL